MSRAWYETIQPFPELREGCPYRCLVTQLEKRCKPPAIVVELTHLNKTQIGRVETIELLLPLRPSGPSIRFFEVCGLDVSTSKKIAPKKAVGSIVLVYFVRSTTGVWQADEFGTLSEEPSDG